MKKSFIMLLIFCLTVSIWAKKNIQPVIHILRFNNQSEYHGSWNIEDEFPLLLQKELNKKGYLKVSTGYDVPESASYLNANIQDFNFKEHIIAAYRVGGYRNYNVKIVTQLLLSTSSSNHPIEKTIETYYSDKSYGLALLGGPGGTGDFETINVYRELQKIPFNSNKFWKTIYGKALKIHMKKTADWIDTYYKKAINEK